MPFQVVGICDPCWAVRFPGKEPFRIADPPGERCSQCGRETRSGIYIRTRVKAT